MYFYENYELLCDAIVKQAAMDFYTALQSEKLHPKDVRVRNRRKDCEGFFYSDWMRYISNRDGREIAKIVRAESI